MSRTLLIVVLVVVGIAAVVALLAIFLPRNRSDAGAVATPQAPVPPSGSAIEGQDWQLVSLGALPAVAGSEATMLLENGRVTGTSGCNNYNGTYLLGEKVALKFGAIAMTQKACEGLMEQERIFGQALAATASYSTAQDSLNLADASGTVVATFKPRSAASLQSTSWVADGINNGKGSVVSIAAGSQVTALFGADGKLTGNAGCNNYSAAYTVTGDKLTIEAPAGTRKMCPDPAIMEQENAYLKALTQVTVFRITGDRLDLRSADGARQVSYTTLAKAPAVATPTPPPAPTAEPPTATATAEPPTPTATATTEPPTSTPEVTAEPPTPTATAETIQLVPSAWNLATLGVVPAAVGSDAFISFEEGGKVSGSTGCNVFNGVFKTPKDGGLTFSELATTKRACPPELAGQEQAFVQALNATRGFSVAGGNLSLTDAPGRVLLTFTERKAMPR